MSSLGANEIAKKGLNYLTGQNLKGKSGAVGARFMKNVTGLGDRNVRNAMLARSAIGAIGGGAFTQATQGDWKSGAMYGGIGGAGLWSIGGRKTLRQLGVAGKRAGRESAISRGLMERGKTSVAKGAAEAQATSQAVVRQTIGEDIHRMPAYQRRAGAPKVGRDLSDVELSQFERNKQRLLHNRGVTGEAGYQTAFARKFGREYDPISNPIAGKPRVNHTAIAHTLRPSAPAVSTLPLPNETPMTRAAVKARMRAAKAKARQR
jgi:hypothetical protein